MTGGYQPQGGRIDAKAEGRRLVGTWSEGDQSGAIELLLREDGRLWFVDATAAHDSGGTREVLDDAPALLWRTEADAVERILAADPGAASRLRERAARFSPQAFVDGFLACVRAIRSAGGTPDRP